MNRSIKIAIYTGAIPSTTFIERLIHGLAEKRFKVYLFGVQKRKTTTYKNIFYITYSNKFSKLFHFFKYGLLLSLYKPNEKKKLDKIILNKKKNSRLLKVKYYPVLYHRPDIFHLQWAKGIEDWIWVQDFGIKLIVSLRGAHINYSPISNSDLAINYKNLFPRVDGFHAVSDAIAIESMKYNASKKSIKVIYSGLDLNQIIFQNKSFDSNTPLNIISVGREHWKKGYSYALNSVKQLKNRGVKFQYIIIGIDRNEEFLHQRHQLSLEEEVIFIDKLPFEEVLNSIKSADVLLLSSVEEGIANVVIEAMAIGTIVVSTDCGGMNEVVSDNKNGFLIPIRDALSMASALQRVSSLSVEDYQKITKAARITIEKQHDIEKMIIEMQTFYHKVLNPKL